MRKSTLIGGLAGLAASMILVLPPPAVSAASAFSDQWVVLRNEDGVPITVTHYDADAGEVECLQPISYYEIPDVDPEPNPVDGRMVYVVPLNGEGSTETAPVVDACSVPNDGAYATEVELERLNLARTSDAVLWKKLAEVGARLAGAEAIAPSPTGTGISLDGAGRITTWNADPLDPSTIIPSAIDASPDYAAIYVAAQGVPPAPPVVTDGKPGTGKPGGLMDTGTIPYWEPDDTIPDYPLSNPAEIVQGPGRFGNWELAAAAIGAAAGKSVKITVDTIEYYNRSSAPEEEVQNWTYASLNLLTDPDDIVNGERFVDYSDFSYTRSSVFRGCTTWLDVPTLRWKTDSVINRVEFGDLPPVATGGTVTNVAGFAQMADDVRAVINYLHENEVVVNPETGEGFFIDPVFTNSCDDQADMVDRLNTEADLARLTVTITDKPDDPTSETSATFAFEPLVSSIWTLDFHCKLDDGLEGECTSPKTYSDLGPGDHTFAVYATAGGVAGLTTFYTWTVADLVVTITPSVEDPTYETSATFEFDAVEPGAEPDAVLDVEFLCTLDEGAETPCDSPETYSGLDPGDHTFTVSATAGDKFGQDSYTWTVLSSGGSSGGSPGGTPPATTPAAPLGDQLDVVSLNPVRLADTRPGWVAADGLFKGTGPVSGGQFVQVPVAGRGGVPVGAQAVVVNVTLVGPAADGFATVYPCETVPFTSSVNYSAGENVANEVFAKLSPTGTICVFTSATANVLVDVAGFVPAGSDLVSLNPVRLADTRPGWVAADGLFKGTGPVSGGQFVQVPVAGRGGVPVGAQAVVVNVTLVGPAADGFATVYPCETVPFTSSVNYSAGENVANEVFAKLSPTGTICVFTSATANVLVDVAGFVPAGSDLVSLNPVRLADTRPGWVAADGLFKGTGPVSGGQFVQVPVAGRGGVPVDAKSVVANVTIADPVAAGYATVYPCETVPFTSSVNYSAGENVANEVFAKLSPTGTICVFTSATANVIVDVAGYL